MPTKAISVVMQLEDEAYLAALRVATLLPDDPVATRDVETILAGFQMLPPS